MRGDKEDMEGLRKVIRQIVDGERERSERYIITLEERIKTLERRVMKMSAKVDEVKEVMQSDLWRHLSVP